MLRGSTTKLQAQDKLFGIILMAVQSLSYLPQEEVGPVQIVPVYPQAHHSGRDAISAGRCEAV